VQSLDDLFRTGVRYSWASGSECEIGLVAAGDVSLPTGSIVVADPDWAMSPLEEADVVAAVVAPGRYAVSLSVATWRQSPNPAFPSPMRRICAAKVHILNEKVDRWRPARTSKESDAEVAGATRDQRGVSSRDPYTGRPSGSGRSPRRSRRTPRRCPGPSPTGSTAPRAWWRRIGRGP
jgi:hypothetical protein